MTNDKLASIYPKNGEKLVCPKCKNTFTVTDDTRYLYGKEYVCNWKCFLTPIESIIVQEEPTKEETSSIVEETPKAEKKPRKKKEVHKEAPLLENGIVDLFG